MKLIDIAKLSTRVFRTRPTRTWLTILGIGVGLGAVLFLVSLGYGLQNILLQKISNDDSLLSLAVINPPSEAVVLDDNVLGSFRLLPNVKDIAPLASLPAQATLKTLTGGVTVEAVDPRFFSYAGVSPLSGELFTDKKDGALISEAVQKLFNLAKPADIIGQPISFEIGSSTKSYQVIGIVEGADSAFVYLPLSVVKNQTPVVQYEQVRVRVDSDLNLDTVREKILARGFQVSSLSDTISQANKIFQAVQIALGLLGAIALFVSAIGMVNTMTVTLLERTSEIGIMRALGASEADIKTLFLGEAMLMGFLGGMAGIIMGVSAGQALNWLLNLLATSLGDKATQLFLYPYWFMATIVIFSGIIGLVTGYLPARRAARLDPLQALRYK